MKIVVIVHTDPWTHSECTDECCGQGTDKTVVGAAANETEAKKYLDWYLKKHNYYNREDFNFEEVEFFNKEELSLEEL